MREFSVPAVATVPETDDAAATVFRRAESEPDAVALRRKSGSGWSDVTCRQFRDEVATLAKGLMAAGVEAGDRVALMAPTRYEWTLIDYAVWSAGGVVVPIYETSSDEQVEWIVGDSGATAIFVHSAELRERVDALGDKVPDLAHVWVIDDALDELRLSGDGQPLEERRGNRGAADLATIVYTSGTTGRPKGCAITHGNLLAGTRNAVQGALTQVFTIKGGSTLLFLPLAHVFARIIEVGCIEGGTVLGHTTIADILPDLASYKPSFILAVPRVFEKVYNGAEQQAAAGGKAKIFRSAADTAIAYSKALDDGGPGLGLRAKHAMFNTLVYGKLRAAVGGRVEYAVSGGAALGDRLGHFFRGVGIIILEGYGLTETTAAASVNLPNQNKIGTVGRPLPGTSFRVGDDGELMISGPNVFGGYWNNEAAGKEILGDDGWLHTGDLGSIDSDGFISVTGRKKEIIVTAAGKNVAPAVLEDRLRGHALVSQCMVVGDAKPFIGALVTLDPEALEFWCTQHGKPADTPVAELAADPEILAEIQAAVDDANQAVSNAEAIKQFQVLDTDFTEDSGHLTPSLKVKRGVVLKDFQPQIDELYTRKRPADK